MLTLTFIAILGIAAIIFLLMDAFIWKPQRMEKREALQEAMQGIEDEDEDDENGSTG